MVHKKYICHHWHQIIGWPVYWVSRKAFSIFNIFSRQKISTCSVQPDAKSTLLVRFHTPWTAPKGLMIFLVISFYRNIAINLFADLWLLLKVILHKSKWCHFLTFCYVAPMFRPSTELFILLPITRPKDLLKLYKMSLAFVGQLKPGIENIKHSTDMERNQCRK